MKTRHKVVIVGAGASGLSACVKLHQLGVEDVVILEAAEDRVGGRVWSDRVREEGEKVELGAQWIHGEDGNVVHQIATDLGFLPDTNDGCLEEKDAVFILNGEIVEEDKIFPIMLALSNIEESLQKMDAEFLSKFSNAEEYFRKGLDDYLSEQGLDSDQCMVSLSQSYMHWFSQLQASIDGAPSMAETAVYQNVYYKECPGLETTNIAKHHCYQELLETYARSVMDKVTFNKNVVKIIGNDDSVSVTTQDGDEVEADVCIVTLPLGVLKHYHKTLFVPELPHWKQDAIGNMGYGTIAKIFICFDVKLTDIAPNLKPAGFNFLREDDKSESGSWTDGVFGVYPDYSDPMVMVAWLSGHNAVSVETMAKEEVMTGVTELIDTFLRPVIPAFPYPVSCHVTRWATSEWSRGSYSYMTPTTPPTSPELLSRPVGRILFAGEATHPHFFSTVHGAVETGWREAERTVAMLNDSHSSKL